MRPSDLPQQLARAFHRRRGWLRWFGLLLSFGSFLALATVLARGDWPTLLEPLRYARLNLLLLALVAALAVELAKAARWLLLLRPPRPPLPSIIGLLLAARLLNLVAPLRAGDAWRVVVAARSSGRAILPSGGALIVEKALDGSGLLLIGLLTLGQLLPDRSTLLALAATAGLILIGLLARRRLPATWLARAAAELEHLHHGALILAATALTTVGLGLGLAVNILVLAALGLELSPTVAASMLLAGYAAALVPAAPGQIGVYELAVSTPLIALGYQSSTAVTAALTLHLLILTNIAVGGLLAIPLRGWSPLSQTASDARL